MNANGQTPAVLEVIGLVKDFGGERALAEVHFDLRAGEIHALLGENGAGKSTLIKVLAGVYRPDSGEVRLGGEPLPDGYAPADASRYGLHFVHQDLGLIDGLTVAENVALEVGFSSRWGLVDIRRTEGRVAALLERQGARISPRTLVGELPQAEKVMVAIARAFSAQARAIVLDEPTASLPGPQAERLADAVRAAARTGVAFIWVTHRLDEISGLADRVTVLRDGRRVATAPAAEVDRGQLVEWIVGRRLDRAPERAPLERGAGGRRLLDVRNLSGLGLREISFEVDAGEIVALTGLIGCGAQEVARLVGGSPRLTGGTVVLDGAPLPLGKPSALRARGVTYVPGDRARDGAFPGLSVRENFFPGRLRGSEDDAFVRQPRRERVATRRLIERFRVRPEGCAELPLDVLSGGNQQKVVFGRALQVRPRVLVLADPTAGVDVGARAELYELLHQAARAGSAVVLASSDFDEVVGEADRALVMVRGRIACDLRRDELTRERLAAESYAVSDLSSEVPA